MSRRSTRQSNSALASNAEPTSTTLEHDNRQAVVANDESSDDEPSQEYYFEGVSYPSYQDMVMAKRKRNQQVLIDSGLLGAVEDLKAAHTSQKKKRKTATTPRVSLPRRSSNRIRGIESDGRYVEQESAGRFVVAAKEGVNTEEASSDSVKYVTPVKETFYNNRINSGDDLSLRQAIEHANGDEDDVEHSQAFVEHLSGKSNSYSTEKTLAATPFDKQHRRNLDKLQVETVAKVTRDRIYSIATHPSSDQLVIAAGDKQGNIGIWNVDGFASNDQDDSHVYEFKYHSGAVNYLQFINNGVLSCSYDGTVRLFDFEKACMQQVFATYDDSSQFKSQLGYGLDTGYHFWTQYLCVDHRTSSNLAFFLSTSTGMVYHVDLRANEVTFGEKLSEKKINTVDLHSDGYSLLTGGLDCQVALWDVRKISNQKKRTPVTLFHSGKSVNSAFFSPSGKHVASTTMADKLDVFTDFHKSSTAITKPTNRITHDNRTGRWLSTFMATWHPSLDIFCVGSMRRPREIQVYDPASNLANISGDDLTAVASRCCFHYNTDRLSIVGGNSSGRVTIIR